MGRRAKKAPVVTKKRVKLAKRFKCPFCANEDVVECKMDHKNGTGSLACRLCGASYSMPIHSLHEPIDVFSEWLDDCEAAANPHDASAAAPARYEDEEDDDDDDAILESSGLGGPSAKASSGGNAAAGGAQRESYTDIGLDDSDDDDDE
ncbi:hypothetical protein MPSEU_000166700 [Mayamaea pseudoterrestris]|nr:hypothetical protein MPSEU_000166700 [Mayamaea pseudoterrestris]